MLCFMARPRSYLAYIAVLSARLSVRDTPALGLCVLF